MSTEPSPPSTDTLKETTEKLATFVQWIVELIQRRNWFTLLLLLCAAWFFFGNPAVFGQAYKLITTQDLPSNYLGIFLLVLGLLFVLALAVAIVTMPPAAKLDTTDKLVRKAIKGLRAFEADDAELFARLQRNQSLQDCLESISRPDFRFGILVGESGCGKTSFLQAGLLPRLNQANSPIQGIYVKFSDRPPISTIATEIVTQLQVPTEQIDLTNFLALITVATEVVKKPILLIFDQFEQFFVHQPYESDREPFIAALKDWYSNSQLQTVKIFVSIRADLQYELNQIQQSLGYTLTPYEIFQLKKFEAAEATEVLRVLAEAEELEFERRFVEELTGRELATSEGKVSPVDLQIVAEIVRKQKTDEQRAFKREAFQKLGGIEGLLNRYLEETLEVLRFQGNAALYQTALQVLLTLTDRERNVRASVLTVDKLQVALKEGASSQEIATAVKWLASSDVRLITPIERGGEVGYELAHERIIPALLRLAGKELKDADRANQLLERRVNEWVGNQYNSRYLLSWQELRLVQSQRNQLTWGENRRQKEKLLKQSWKRWNQRFGIGVAILVLLLVGWLLSLTSPVQQWLMYRELATLSRTVSHDLRVEAINAFAMNEDWEEAKASIHSMEKIDSDNTSLGIYSVISAVEKLDESSRAKSILNELETIAINIKDNASRARVLNAIAQAYSKMNNSKSAEALLKQAQKTALSIQNNGDKASVLGETAQAYSKMNNSKSAEALLKQAQKTALSIQDDNDKVKALRKIAQDYSKLNDAKVAESGLQQLQTIASNIQSDSDKSKVLEEIAQGYSKLNDTKAAESGLQQLQTVASNIQSDSDKASVLVEIAQAYNKLNNAKAAEPVLEQAQKAALSIQDRRDKTPVLVEIAKAYSKLNSSELATNNLQQLQANIINIYDDDKAEAVGAVARAYSKLDDTKAAESGLQQLQTIAINIQFDSNKAKALGEIAQAYSELNNFESAKTVKAELQKLQASVISIHSDYDKAETVRAIAWAYSNLIDTKAAESGLQQLQTIAGNIQSDGDKAKALGEIAQVYSKLNNFESAKTILEQAQSSAANIQSSVEGSHIMSSLVGIACFIAEEAQEQNQSEVAESLIHQAQNITKSIRDNPLPSGTVYAGEDAFRGERTAALEFLVKSCARIQKWRQVNLAVEQCTSEECKALTLAKAFIIRAELKHPELAKSKEQESDPNGENN